MMVGYIGVSNMNTLRRDTDGVEHDGWGQGGRWWQLVVWSGEKVRGRKY